MREEAMAVVAKVCVGMGAALDEHEGGCTGHVTGFALHPYDHDRLAMAELWGLPVLAWDEVARGDFRLVCDHCGVLVPQLDGPEDLFDYWRDRPVAGQDSRSCGAGGSPRSSSSTRTPAV